VLGKAALHLQDPRITTIVFWGKENIKLIKDIWRSLLPVVPREQIVVVGGLGSNM
tara:strand:- start:328 stop:492 length:165 start_codon:yes stop_codon:yes gene_type:complete